MSEMEGTFVSVGTVDPQDAGAYLVGIGVTRVRVVPVASFGPKDTPIIMVSMHQAEKILGVIEALEKAEKEAREAAAKNDEGEA